MPRVRTLLLGTVAAFMVVPGASAMAWLSPAGPVTGTASQATFTVSPQIKFVCKTSTVSGVVNPPGVGKPQFTGEAPTFSGCESPPSGGSQGLGPLTITANEAIGLVFEGTTRVALSKINLHVKFINWGCSLDMQGTEYMPGAKLLTSLAITGEMAPSSLLENNIMAGSCTLLFGKGQPVKMAASYALSRYLEV